MPHAGRMRQTSLSTNWWHEQCWCIKLLHPKTLKLSGHLSVKSACRTIAGYTSKWILYALAKRIVMRWRAVELTEMILFNSHPERKRDHAERLHYNSELVLLREPRRRRGGGRPGRRRSA